MPVDTSIYGQLQAPQPVNQLAGLAQAYQIKGLQNAIDKSDREAAQQNRLLQLVGNPEFAGLSTADKASRLQGVGAFNQAGELVKADAAANKDNREADRVKLDMAIKQREQMSGALMQLAKDPSQAQSTIGMLVQQGIIAPEYGQKILQGASQSGNPSQFFMQGAQAAISAKDQLAQQIQQQGQAITMRGQDMSADTARRGQDMADARAKEQAQAGRVPSGYRQAADGTLEFIPGGPADPNTKPAGGKPLNDTQAKALQFGTRMQVASDELEQLAAAGTDQPGLIKRAADAVGLGTAANITQSESQQKVEQAQRDFINAVLRRESGAAIAQSEFDNAKRQYFPQIGDSPGVKAQKKQNREIAMRGILAEVPDAENRVAQVRGTATPAAAKPAATTRKVVAGKTYENDGKGWYLVN